MKQTLLAYLQYNVTRLPVECCAHFLVFILSSSLCIYLPKYLQVNSRDKQSEMRSSRSLGDLKGSLLKGSERVRKHSTGELDAKSRAISPNAVRELLTLLWQILFLSNLSSV